MLGKFKSVYKNLNADNVPIVEAIYEEGVIFIDPFHEIKGVRNLVPYFEKLYRNIESCKFDFLNEYSLESSAMITWIMTFSHKSLGKKQIVVPGSTEIHFNEKIYYHRDYFDAGKMVYENVPLVGPAVNYIKRKM